MNDEQYNRLLNATVLVETAGIEPLDPSTPGASAHPERVALYWLYQWEGLQRATKAA